jgi:hypothetical protein
VGGLVTVVVALSILGGCQGDGTPNPDDPYAGLPSNGCGGFHLKVVNTTAASVRVTLSHAWSIVVPARSTETVVQFDPPDKPPLPWQVVITDESSGRQLFSAAMPGPVDQKVTLSADGPVQAPYDLREDCSPTSDP